jgi:protein TonB
MFSVYGKGPRKRRHWSTSTIAISVLAHAAALGGVIVSAERAEAKAAREVVIAEWKLDEEKPKPKPTPPPPPPPEPEPPQPKEPPKVELAQKPEPEPVRLRAPRPPAPVKGDFVTPRPPENPPVGIPAPDMNAQPITQVDVSGIGKEGDVVGTVDVTDTRAPTGNTAPSEEKEAPPAPPAAEPAEEPNNGEPLAESEVDVRPSLRNGDEVQRALQRVYPDQLRDAGVTGETVLQFVIDENGRVEAGSVEIVSSSDDAFAAAARRIVSSMRFTPARSGGRTVRVTTTLPVRWTVER